MLSAPTQNSPVQDPPAQSVPTQSSPVQSAPAQGSQPPKKKNVVLIVLIVVVAVIAAIIIGIVGLISVFKSKVKAGLEKKNAIESTDFNYDAPEDIDLDSLNEAVDAMKDLDLNTDIDADIKEPEVPETPEVSNEDKVNYSYADVIYEGNNIRVVPNGGLNSSTVFAAGKDLGGFLDYVDSKVLEEGRYINRDLFYDILATMLVDKDLSPGFENSERNMIMALAMANNFHDIKVKIRECNLDANNAAEYKYQVTAFDKDDTWIVNYNDRTVFFNDGKTEYHSDMFKDEYLAVWFVAIDEYYGK